MTELDESIFDIVFSPIQDGKSTWHLFTADHTEFYHTGEEACGDADILITRSNSGQIFDNEEGKPVCTFSIAMTSPNWLLVREISMENYEQQHAAERDHPNGRGGTAARRICPLHDQ